MIFYSKNAYLTREEMQVNALYIWDVLRGYGWSMPAVAAMLGNMESESTINPGIYEGLNSLTETNGFGLVQWTPNTKYKTWADENGYAYGDINGQIMRIIYELENGLQWISTDSYPLSFVDFSKSTMTPEYLANAFLYNYERPSSLNQPNRATQARSWYHYLIENGNASGGLDITYRRMPKVLLFSGAIRRR